MALTFSRFDFVATQILLRLFVDLVLARDRIILLKTQLFSGRLSILDGIVRPVSRSRRHQTN